MIVTCGVVLLGHLGQICALDLFLRVDKRVQVAGGQHAGRLNADRHASVLQ